ncbi:hypothetical protein B7G68_00495 [Caulobacter segnis]|uniref:Efflux transporter n=2 Tax=Caulobacter segnis TaxID=88688 RepID=D5VDS2_CAUST|nr:hypothetical protein [Caulobacter segnis]ADG08622.1 efflux transporter [Caulobacter segnis ATCC 21756]AVQ00475.1 hypothetical protein B7G68_00495 [Caulobacter segnis]
MTVHAVSRMRRALVVLYAAGLGAILVVAGFLAHEGQWILLAPVIASFAAASAGFVALMRLADHHATLGLTPGRRRLLLTFALISAAAFIAGLVTAWRLL